MTVSRRIGRVLLPTALAAAAVGVGYGLGTLAGGAGEPMAHDLSAGAHAVADWLEIPAPDVAFGTVEGDSVRLSDYRGQIVVLNFWGSWCPPCLIEIPQLIEVQEILSGLGGTIIGPAVDSGGPDDVRQFAQQMGVNYPVWMSDYQTAVGRFGAPGYPYTLLIDRDGIIRRQYLGPQTARTLLRDIGDLMAQMAGPQADTTGSLASS